MCEDRLILLLHNINSDIEKVMSDQLILLNHIQLLEKMKFRDVVTEVIRQLTLPLDSKADSFEDILALNAKNHLKMRTKPV